MKIKKILAAALSCCVVGGIVPQIRNAISENALTASAEDDEEDYTQGKYGLMSYHAYSDHIEIASCSQTANGEIVIPSEIDKLPVTSIGAWAFQYCRGLTSIIIPDSVNTIEDFAFLNCTSLISMEIPDSVTCLGSMAFHGCYSLTSVTISNSVTEILSDTFMKCSNLKSVNIPESVTSIEKMAFYECNRLESITIENPDCEIYDESSTIANSFDIIGESFYNGTIYGYANSTAQAFAEKYGYKFVEISKASIGDVDDSGTVDAIDASLVLTAYALKATGQQLNLDEVHLNAADVNQDGSADAVDASLILSYYAYTATGGTDSLDAFLKH